MTEQRNETDRLSRGGRARRWLVRLAVAGAMLAGILALTAHLLRDQPRRLLERTLSSRLDARVTVEKLRLRPQVELSGVRIRSMRALPALESLVAPRVVVRGHWRALLRGEVERLVVPEARAVLEPVCGRPLELPPTRGRIGRIELGALELEVRDGERRARAVVTGVIERGAGDGAVARALDPSTRGMTGQLALRSEVLELSPVLALLRPELAVRCSGGDPLPLAVRVEDASGELTLSRAADDGTAAGGRAPLEAHGRLTATRAQASGAGVEVEIPAPVLEAALRLAGEAGATVSATLRADGLDRAALELASGGAAALSGDTAARLDLTVEGLDLGPLLPLAGALGAHGELTGAGRLDARIERDGDDWPFRARVRLDSLRVDGLESPYTGAELAGVAADLTGVLQPLAGSPSGARVLERYAARDLDLRSSADSLRVLGAGLGTLGDLRWVAPLQVAWTGEASEGALRGSARLDSEGIGAWRAGGHVSLPADGVQSALALDWSWQGDRLAALVERWRALGGAWPEEVAVAGAIAARGRLRGPLAAPRVDARLSLAEPVVEVAVPAGAFSSEGDELRVGARAVSLALTAAGSRARGLSLRTEAPARATLAIGEHEVEATLSAAGGWAGSRGTLDRLELDGGDLGLLTIRDAAVERAGQSWRAQGSLALHDASLPAWRERWVPDDAEWAKHLEPLEGALEVELQGTWTGDGEWSAAGDLILAGGGWASADGARVVQGFEPRLALALRPASGGVEVALDGPVGGFQALWDALFFDYGSRFAQLHATARWRPDATGRGAGAPPEGPPITGVLRLDGDGIAAHGRLGWSGADALEAAVTVEAADLESAWRTWVREPVAGSGALAERIGLAGRARVELAAAREGDLWDLEGEVELDDAVVTVGEDSELRGLFLALPLDLELRRGADGRVEARGPETSGALRFTRLRAGGLEVAPVDATLTLEGERVSLRERLSVPLFAGVVELDAVALEGLLAGRPAFEADVQVSGLDLRQATEAFGLFPLEGRVDARFPRVRVGEGRLETDVEGSVAIFGGRAEVTELTGSDLFDPFPHLQLSARLHDIDLSELTRTLEFGEITGIAMGEIEDLELVGGTPVRFEGWLRSVPERRVKRRVSIRAVNNLARLGTGADVGVLQRGIRKLFDSYPYQSLGLSLALHQDDFLLRGLERRGDKELFLKGRWPLRLDIVNVEPGTRVSFTTMMRRIGNLEIRRGAPEPASESPR
jgi:hypothetical protein